MSGETEDQLPGHPILAEAARSLRDRQQMGAVYDADWICVFESEDGRRVKGYGDLNESMVGYHVLNIAHLDYRLESNRPFWLQTGGLVLADTRGGKEALRPLVHPSLRELVDDLIPIAETMTSARFTAPSLHGSTSSMDFVKIRLRDPAGNFVGTVELNKPGVDSYKLSLLSALADTGHLQRMQSAIRSARRPAAILCADLDRSTPLSKRLSAVSYFRLVRRLVFAADRCIVRSGGLVGRHAGDGMTAFFLAESLGSESSAASACIAAARTIKLMAREAFVQSEVDPEDALLRFGLHWGSTLYVGAIATEARFEVTALGDQVNEAARIEACATGGRTLASKEIIERLTTADATRLGIAPDHLSYTPLADLASATEKARRDAPSIAVCDL